MTRRATAKRWFLPHLTAYLAASLGGIATAFGLRPDLGFPIFAALLGWGLVMALHGWVVIMPASPRDDNGSEGDPR
jgi:hypothetical protein